MQTIASEEPNATLVMFPSLVKQLGDQEARRLAKTACGHIHGVFNDAELSTILQFDLPFQIKLCDRIVMMRQSHQQTLVRTPQEARLFVQVVLHDGQHMDGGLRHAWYGLQWALEWVPTEYIHGSHSKVTDKDPERPIRVYRWFMQTAREVPIREWNNPQITGQLADSWHQNSIAELDKMLRETLRKLGYRFAKVETVHEQGVARLTAVLRTGDNWVYHFYHQDGNRKEVIAEGDEVILAQHYVEQLSGKEAVQHFVQRTVELHPATGPTDAMRQALIGRNGF